MTETKTQTPEKEILSRYPEPYFVENGNLYMYESTRNGEVPRFISNFTPWISKVMTYDDGRSPVKKYAVRGEVAGGKALPEIILSADEINNFNWLSAKWDTECNISPQYNAREKLRFALHHTTATAERTTCYTTTGWHNTEKGLMYLLPGNKSFDVELQGKLKNYRTEDGVTDKDRHKIKDLVSSSFIPRSVLLPCLALVFLSPLNSMLDKAGYEPKFIMLLVGRTGSMKSTVAALMLSFFGDFTATELPMSFHDTANSIDQKAFILKDVLSCVDDYHPTTGNDAIDMKKLMQHLCRAVGDRMGRGRLNQHLDFRPSYPPQGNIIVTAEHIPDVGESGIARFFTLELNSGEIDLPMLTKAQRDASDGVYRRIMSDYIGYWQSVFSSAGKYEGTIEAFRAAHEKGRDSCRKYLSENRVSGHARIPDAVASLRLGFTMFLAYMMWCGQLTHEEMGVLADEFEALIHSLALCQCKSVADDRPTHIYIRKLMALIESGEANMQTVGGAESLPLNCLGYQDENFYYVFLEGSHKTVKRLCDMQGESFPISTQGLAKALANEGFIDTSGGSNTRTKRFGSRKVRVMYLKKAEAWRICGYAEESV